MIPSVLPARRFLLAACFSATPLIAQEQSRLVQRRLALMGTMLEVAVSSESRERSLEASEFAVREIERVETLLSTWRRGGPLSALNEAPPGEAVAVPSELVTLLRETFDWTERTRRAFDPTVLPLVRAWDLRGGGRIPASGEKERAVEATGTRWFHLDPEHETVVRLCGQSGIDEGAWGKGYALDRAASALRAFGVASAVLDLGGQVLAVGPSDPGPRVGIAHPRFRARPVMSLRLREASVSTSGNSERAVEVAGRHIGHLLDPRSGEPAPDFGSVSVIAPSAYIADVLSTALFVLGPDEGVRLSSELRAGGVAHEVLFLIDRGEFLEVRTSPGFARFVEFIDTKTVHGMAKQEDLHEETVPSPEARDPARARGLLRHGVTSSARPGISAVGRGADHEAREAPRGDPCGVGGRAREAG